MLSSFSATEFQLVRPANHTLINIPALSNGTMVWVMSK